jgi:inorganic pyrophosphatase
VIGLFSEAPKRQRGVPIVTTDLGHDINVAKGRRRLVNVFIENEAGSLVKHLYNEKTQTLLGTAAVSRAYPFPYGFVLNTRGEDGDNVDCFVLTTKRLSTGQIVQCSAIGLLEQVEDGEIDHKVLAVLEGEATKLDGDNKLRLVEFTSHVFDHIPGKKMQIGNFRDKEAALEYVQHHQDPDSPATAE